MTTLLEQLNNTTPRRGRRRSSFNVNDRRTLERTYAIGIRKFTTDLRKRTVEAIKRTRDGAPGVILDTKADDFARTFRALRAFYENTPEQVTEVVRSFTNEANEQNKRQFYRGLQRAYGVDVANLIVEENLEEVLTAATGENVSLIKSIPSQYFDKVEQAVYRNLSGGGTAKSLQEELQRIGNVTKGRAKLIARDQNSKLNNRLNRERQINLGVKRYEWVTAKDERVRETHRRNNGKIFTWDRPPPETGHPGEDIQCRCIPRPILDL